MSKAAVAVIGGAGQVARALQRRAEHHGIPLAARGRPLLDINDMQSVATFLYETQPRVVVNAAAYTAVDQAESEPDAAFRANAEGPARLAVLCHAAGVPLIHISTDYVFDGTKPDAYIETDAVAPLSVYGASKAAGEDAVRGAAAKHAILRTSWVYDAEGANFLTTMLRLGAEREELRIVADQLGAPTAAGDLADAILAVANALLQEGGEARSGTYHVTGTGMTTWHGFATEIFRLAAARGAHVPRTVPIATAEYPTAARRPANSRLDCGKIERTFGVALPRWQDSLAAVMSSMRIGN